MVAVLAQTPSLSPFLQLGIAGAILFALLLIVWWFLGFMGKHLDRNTDAMKAWADEQRKAAEENRRAAEAIDRLSDRVERMERQ